MPAAAAAFALAALHFGLRLELGPEYDSNANHAVEAGPASGLPGPVESFLLRGVARGKLDWSSGGNALRLALDLGGKWFFADAAGPQDVVVARLSLDERSRLSPHFLVGFGADYHDAYQLHDCPPVSVTDAQGNATLLPDTSCHRDFRLAGARARALWAGEVPSLQLELSARNYQWKPDDDLTFYGLGAALTPSLRMRDVGGGDDEPRDLVLQASGRLEYRHYSGPALTDAADMGSAVEPRRADLVGTWSATLSWSGPLLASVGYLGEVDRSNSFGGSYLYHAVTLGLTMPLALRMVAALRAQLLFFQSGALPVSLTVEDENRDAILFDLSRELGANFTLHARYSVYRNAGGDLDGRYLRQLVFLGATWESR